MCHLPKYFILLISFINYMFSTLTQNYYYFLFDACLNRTFHIYIYITDAPNLSKCAITFLFLDICIL